MNGKLIFSISDKAIIGNNINPFAGLAAPDQNKKLLKQVAKVLSMPDVSIDKMDDKTVAAILASMKQAIDKGISEKPKVTQPENVVKNLPKIAPGVPVMEGTSITRNKGYLSKAEMKIDQIVKHLKAVKQ